MPIVPVALIAVGLTILNLGRIRMGRVYFGHPEWTNGWPCVFLSRDVRRAVPGGDPEAGIPGPTVHWFQPAAAVADALVALLALGGASWATWRRSRSARPFQYGLRGLLVAVSAVGALLGWELHHHRRQQRVIDSSADLYFGFYVDQGLPHVLRRFLRGARLRLFDRITLVEIGGPDCVGDRLKPLASLHEMAMLDIGSNQVDDAAIKHLTDLRRLVYVKLSGSPNLLSDFGLHDLCELADLRELDIGSSQVTDDGLVCLARLKRLERLDLHGVKGISDAGLVHLRGLRSLKSLTLYGTAVGDAGANVIADLPNLEKLDLSETLITDTGLMRLSTLKHLSIIVVPSKHVTKEGIARFKRARPGCRVFQ